MNQPEVLPAAMNLPQNLIFLIALLVSLGILAWGVIYLLRRILSRSGSDAGNAFQRFTLLVLLAVAVMFLPVYYQSYSFEDSYPVFRPALLAIHNAMRVFILDGEFDFIRNGIQGMKGVLHVFFSFYAAVLYVAAPAIFTFTVFISIFRDAFTEIVFFFHRKSPLFIFSCLNESAAAMAVSILQSDGVQETDRRAKGLIVFCGVPRDGEEREKQTALVPVLTGRQALVLFTAKTADQLNLSRFHNEITFFLMDPSDAKNVQDASALSDALLKQAEEKQVEPAPAGQRPRIPRILVYAASPASIPLIEAITHPEKNGEKNISRVTVPDATIAKIKDIIDSACSTDSSKETNQANIVHAIQNGLQAQPLLFSQPFSLMRVDVKKQMALRIIRDIQNSEAYQTSMDTQNSVTITLLGLGGIGKEILETLLWMCQQYERRLIVNVFDTTGPELGDDPDAAHNPLYDRLAYEWPELISTNRQWQRDPASRPDTEADYDIRFFFGMDCFSNRFRELFENGSDTSRRLQQSALVICSLGNDDRNLEAALMMRQLFKGKTGNRQPDIYAVVYDDQQSDCVSAHGQLTHYYKNTPYDVKTVGSMREQYDFTGIADMAEIEKTALVHHISWICTRTETDKNPWPAMKDEDKTTALKSALDRYIHYEYYRQSSLAKAIHKNSLEARHVYPWDGTLLQDKKRHDFNNLGCRCPLCQSRITEHMRWNAYMRVKGYRYGSERNDMAKIHDCLKPWTGLPARNRISD